MRTMLNTNCFQRIKKWGGREINMSSGEISDIENGKKKDPRISTLIRIADYFNISLDELIGRKSED